MFALNFNADTKIPQPYKNGENEVTTLDDLPVSRTFTLEPFLDQLKEILDSDFFIQEALTTKPLPSLNKQIQINIIKLLTRPFVVRANNESFELEITLLELFSYLDECINKNSNLNIDKIEIVGGTVFWLLKDYLRSVLDRLGIKNPEILLTPEILKGWESMPPDVDIRLNVPKAGNNDLEKLNYLVEDFLTKKLCNRKCFQETKNLVHQQAFLNFNTVNNGNYFSTISLGDRKGGTNLDLLFVCVLKRLSLFIQDGLRINISPILERLKEKNGDPFLLIDAIEKDELSLDIIPKSNFRNGWQAIIDRLAGIVRAEKPETINEAGWSLLMLAYTKGKRSFQEELEPILLETFEKKYSQNEKLNAVIFWLNKAIINHLSNKPEAAFSLLVNACASLQSRHPEVVLSSWKTLRVHFAKSTNPFIAKIDSLMTQKKCDFKNVYALLQAKAFLGLWSNSESKLFMHNGKPSIQLKIENYHILLPFDPLNLFKFFSNARIKSWDLLLPVSPYAYSEILESCQIDWQEMERIAYEMIDSNSKLGVELLLICFCQTRNKKAFDILIDLIPSFITNSRIMHSLKNLNLSPEATRVLYHYESLEEVYPDALYKWAHALALSGSGSYALRAFHLWDSQKIDSKLSIAFLKDLAFLRPDLAMSILLELKERKKAPGSLLIEGWISICNACKISKPVIDFAMLIKGLEELFQSHCSASSECLIYLEWIFSALLKQDQFDHINELLQLIIKDHFQHEVFELLPSFISRLFLKIGQASKLNVMLEKKIEENHFHEAFHFLTSALNTKFDFSKEKSLKSTILKLFDLLLKKNELNKILSLLLNPNFHSLFDLSESMVVRCQYLEKAFLTNRKKFKSSIEGQLKIVLEKMHEADIQSRIPCSNFICNYLEFCPEPIKLQIDNSLIKIIHPLIENNDKARIVRLLTLRSLDCKINRLLLFETKFTELKKLLHPKFFVKILLSVADHVLKNPNFKELFSLLKLFKKVEIPPGTWAVLMKKISFQNNPDLQIECYQTLCHLILDPSAEADCWLSCLEGLNKYPHDESILKIFTNISSFIHAFKDPVPMAKKNHSISLLFNSIEKDFFLDHLDIIISAQKKLLEAFDLDEPLKQKIALSLLNLQSCSNDFKILEGVCKQLLLILNTTGSNQDVEKSILNLTKGISKIKIPKKHSIIISLNQLIEMSTKSCDLTLIGYPILSLLGKNTNSDIVCMCCSLLNFLLRKGSAEAEPIHVLLDNAINHHFIETRGILKTCLSANKPNALLKEKWLSPLIFSFIKQYLSFCKNSKDNYIENINDIIKLISLNLICFDITSINKCIKIAVKYIYYIGFKDVDEMEDLLAIFLKVIKKTYSDNSTEFVTNMIDQCKMYFIYKIIRTRFYLIGVEKKTYFINLVYKMLKEIIGKRNKNSSHLYTLLERFAIFTFTRDQEKIYRNHIEILRELISKAISNGVLKPELLPFSIPHLNLPFITRNHFSKKTPTPKIFSDLFQALLKQDNKEGIKEAIFMFQEGKTCVLKGKALWNCYIQTIKKIHKISKSPEEELILLDYLAKGATKDYKYSKNKLILKNKNKKWETISNNIFQLIIDNIISVNVQSSVNLIELKYSIFFNFLNSILDKNGYSDQYMKLFQSCDLNPRSFKFSMNFVKLYKKIILNLQNKLFSYNVNKILNNPKILLPDLILGKLCGLANVLISYLLKQYFSRTTVVAAAYLPISTTIVPAWGGHGTLNQASYVAAAMGAIGGLALYVPYQIRFNCLEDSNAALSYQDYIYLFTTGVISWGISSIVAKIIPKISAPNFEKIKEDT